MDKKKLVITLLLLSCVVFTVFYSHYNKIKSDIITSIKNQYSENQNNITSSQSISSIEELVHYDNGDPSKYLTNAEYIINSEIFDVELKKLDSLGNIEIPPYSVEKQETILKDEWQLVALPDDFTGQMPVLLSDLLFYFVEEKVDQTYLYSIYAYDIHKEEVVRNFETRYEGMNFVSMVGGIEGLYVLESDCNYSENDPEWVIYYMDITGTILTEIDNSDRYGATTMLPMLFAYEGKLSYVVGEESGGEVNHYVMLYQECEQKCIFNIRNVKSPYVAPQIDEDGIYYPEYFEEGWYLLKYEFSSSTITRYKIPFLTKGEYPQVFTKLDDEIIYQSGTYGILYVTNINNGEFHVIARNGGGVGKGALFANKYFYRYKRSIWIYDLINNCKYLYRDLNEYEKYTSCSGIAIQNNKLFVLLKQIEDDAFKYYIVIL